MEHGQTRRHRILYASLRAVLLLLLLLSFTGGLLALVLYSFPSLEEKEISVLRSFPPPNFAQLKKQREVLLSYAHSNPAATLSGFCLLYISMQTFAIPGTLSLSILSGALYGVPKGLLLVSIVSTVGAFCCFLLSNAIGRGLAQAIWPAKIEKFGREVNKRRHDMLSYIIFLRVTPILPNTFINISSPVVQVPVVPFLLGTFIGCMPNNFIAVNAGLQMGSLQSFRDLYDVRQLLLGIVIGGIALLPVYLRRKSSSRRLD